MHSIMYGKHVLRPGCIGRNTGIVLFRIGGSFFRDQGLRAFPSAIRKNRKYRVANTRESIH